MRLTRVYVDAALMRGSVVELPSETASHLAKVLRVRNGEGLVLFNGDGCEFDGTIVTVRGSRVSVAIAQDRPVDRESPFAATLVQCVPRGDRMDFIVQKATELGVARIAPILSQRSVVRLDEQQAQSKAAHWRAVAVSACEQCGRTRLPIIEPVRRLLHYLGDVAPGDTAPDEGLRLVFEPESQRSAQPAAPDTIAAAEVAIGPEGGLEDSELALLAAAHFRPVSLGRSVLRFETAALAALAVVRSALATLPPSVKGTRDDVDE